MMILDSGLLILGHPVYGDGFGEKLLNAVFKSAKIQIKAYQNSHIRT